MTDRAISLLLAATTCGERGVMVMLEQSIGDKVTSQELVDLGLTTHKDRVEGGIPARRIVATVRGHLVADAIRGVAKAAIAGEIV